jgi:hypothetical protein
MNVGEGGGILLADIVRGKTRAQIREGWLRGDYGGKQDRPRAKYVDWCLKMAGR